MALPVQPLLERNGADGDRLSVLHDLEGFETLKAEWPDFLSRCEADHPFNTHAWLTAWCRNFGKGMPVEIVVVRRGGKLACCLPMTFDRIAALRRPFRRRTLWVNSHSFRSGILCDVDHLDCLDQVAAHLAARKDWDILDLHFLPVGMQATHAFAEAVGRLGMQVHATPHMRSPRLEVAGTWEDYMASWSSKRRYWVRRLERQAIEKVHARAEITVGRVSDLEERLETCWEVSRKTWKHRSGSSIAADPVRMQFYREVAHDPSDQVVIGLLYFEDRPVAFEYGLLYGGVLHCMKVGIDEDVRKYLPGVMLSVQILKWAFARDVRVYDWMGFSAPHKEHFSSGALAHECLRVYQRGFLPQLLFRYESQAKPIAGYVRDAVQKRLPGAGALRRRPHDLGGGGDVGE